MDILESENLTVQRTTKGKLPSLPFVRIKESILGKKFDVSISFVSPSEAQRINIENRNKDYIPNVLSFPLSESSGEIIMSLSTIRREAKKFGYTYDECILFMLIHGLLHVKGLDHGDEMEMLEQKYFKQYRQQLS